METLVRTQTLLPLLEKMKTAYALWYSYYQILPKTHRYSLGKRIDAIFIDAIDATATASFLPKERKLPFVQLAIRKLDTNKILLLVLWENRSLDTKKYSSLSEQLDAVGKMLGGWQGQLTKTHSGGRPE